MWEIKVIMWDNGKKNCDLFKVVIYYDSVSEGSSIDS